MQSYTAEIPEIVRSNRKDQVLIDQLHVQITQVAAIVLGPRLLGRHQARLAQLAELLYYTATTVKGVQTIGEEYIGLLSVNSNHTVPNSFIRLLYTVLLVFGQPITEQLLRLCERHIQQWPTTHSLFAIRHNWLYLINCARSALPVLSRVHLAVFYIGGAHYHLSKRLFGVQYLSVRPSNTDSSTAVLFKGLGYSILGQVLFSLAHRVYTDWLSAHNSNQSLHSQPGHISEALADHWKDFTCSICLEQSVPPVCTPCGHVFCWDCVLGGQCVQCPLCRTPLNIHACVPLYNY